MATGTKKFGKAVLELSFNDKVTGGLKRIQAKVAKIGASINRIGRAGLAAGASIASAFILPVKAASDLQETMNKFNVVFGDNAKEVKAWGDDFAGQVGRSKKQIADFLGGSQDLFVPLGFEPGAATEMSKQVTALAIDLASFNNLSDEAPMQDLQAALTGSGEVMKKYGVLVNEAAVKQELLNQGLDPKAATDQQKVQARLNIIMKGTTAAQGDAIRSAGSFANQTKALKASLMDNAAVVGNAILPAVTSFVSMLREGVSAVGGFVERNSKLVTIIAAVGAGLILAGSTLLAIGTAVQIAAFAVGGLAAAFSAVLAVIGAIVSPLGLVAAGIVAATTGFLKFTETGQEMAESLGEFFGGLFDIAKQTFSGISKLLAAGEIQAAASLLWDGLKLLWLQGTASIRQKWHEMTGFLVKVWHGSVIGLAKILTSGLTAIKNGFDFVGTTIVNAFVSAFAAVKKAWNTTVAFFKTTWQRLKGLFGADVAGEIQRINDELQTSNKAIDEKTKAGNQGREKRFLERTQARDTESRGIISALEEDLERRFQATDDGTKQKIKEAQEALKVAKESFNAASDAADAVTVATEQETKKKKEEKEVSEGQVKSALKSAGSARPQAVFDATFASQQFGGNTEIDLLRLIAKNTKKSADKEPGLEVG